ncbi:uncharacterized protein LOC131158346 [Malania oleifera]|uniref:uncharacterized protein LOC131158346 n=1 Tax=Malania oleifera TaxID=397392 RepID=UPI0025AEC2FD|nr:uncharacterized protein LOC131158346 [Malania oleifera]
MEVEPDLVDLKPADVRNRSVSDIFSYLKCTFRPRDFDMVEQILVSREEKHRREEEESGARTKKVVSDLLVKIELIEEQNADLKNKMKDLESAKARAEAEVEAWKKRFVELEGRVLLLEEDTAVLMRKENGVENRGSMCAKVKGHHSIDIVRVLGEEESNPSDSEMKYGMHVKGQSVVEELGINQNTVSPTADGWKPASGCVIEISDSDGEIPINKQNAVGPMDWASGGFLSGKETTQKFESRACSGQIEEVNAIGCMEKCLLTSAFKRKRASCTNTSDNDDSDDSSPIGECKLKPHQELINGFKVSPFSHRTAQPIFSGSITVEKSVGHSTQDSFPLRLFEGKNRAEQNSQNHLNKFVVDSSDSSDSSDSGDSSVDSQDEVKRDLGISQLISRLRRIKDNEMWESELDMLSAFKNCPRFCMEAVCALYRQQISVGKSVVDRGFSELDAFRVTCLAKFLIDGDPQHKMNKSISELQKHDPKGLSDCRRLATQYSKQLFEIYSKKEDPLFPPSGTISSTKLFL